MFSRRAASEFPNDNPELHDGLVWQSDSVCGRVIPMLRLRPVIGKIPKVIGPVWIESARRAAAFPVPVNVPVPVHVPVPERAPASDVAVTSSPAALDADAEPDPIVEATSLVAPEPIVEPEPVIASPPEPEPEAARALESASPTAPVDAASISAFDALTAALSRVALDRGATRLAAELPAVLASGRAPKDLVDGARAKKLIALGPAWRAALDGGDLAGCGDQPLDVWASELLAALLTAPGERETLRRALRRHGVAAFGMLVAA